MYIHHPGVSFDSSPIIIIGKMSFVFGFNYCYLFTGLEGFCDKIILEQSIPSFCNRKCAFFHYVLCGIWELQAIIPSEETVIFRSSWSRSTLPQNAFKSARYIMLDIKCGIIVSLKN